MSDYAEHRRVHVPPSKKGKPMELKGRPRTRSHTALLELQSIMSP